MRLNAKKYVVDDASINARTQQYRARRSYNGLITIDRLMNRKKRDCSAFCRTSRSEFDRRSYSTTAAMEQLIEDSFSRYALCLQWRFRKRMVRSRLELFVGRDCKEKRKKRALAKWREALISSGIQTEHQEAESCHQIEQIVAPRGEKIQLRGRHVLSQWGTFHGSDFPAESGGRQKGRSLE